MRRTRILWISPTLPFPVNAGNRRHLNYLITDARNNGATIDFVLYGWEQEAIGHQSQLEAAFHRYLNIPQPSTRSMSFNNYWGIDDWVSNDLLSAISRFASGRDYDAVFVEYVWMSKVLTLFSNSVVKVIDTHDIFSNRDALLQSHGIEKQWYYTRASEESLGLARADIVLGITQEDCDFFTEILANQKSPTKVLVRGTGIVKRPSTHDEIPGEQRRIRVGYLASSNALNKASANRFFSELNKHASKSSDFAFHVAGTISSHIGSYNNLDLHRRGYVGDPAEFYHSVDLIIAPMVEGTGLKIKTVEAIEYQKPFMATKHATAGLPVSSTWHTLPSVHIFAKYFAKWMQAPATHTHAATMIYLAAQTQTIHSELAARQELYTEAFWRLLHKMVEMKMADSLPTQSSRVQKIPQKRPTNSSLVDKGAPRPAVSVVIAAFNTQEYIHRCLDSLVSDNLFSETQVIVVDDGSSDNTPDIATAYANTHNNIQLIRQPHSGPGTARNRGIDAADGEYLYFVDSDDYLGNGALAHLYEAAKRDNIDICSPDRPYLTARPLKYISALPGWCCFIKRDLLSRHNFPIRQPSIRSGQDGVFANMILTRCESAAVCKAAKYYYEKRETSTFHSLKRDLAAVPLLVEQHLNALRHFYSANNLWHSQAIRYLYFLQDETYKWRYKAHLGELPELSARHIYAAIQCELATKSCYIKDLNQDSLRFFSKEFLSIVSLNYEQHRELYG